MISFFENRIINHGKPLGWSPLSCKQLVKVKVADPVQESKQRQCVRQWRRSLLTVAPNPKAAREHVC